MLKVNKVKLNKAYEKPIGNIPLDFTGPGCPHRLAFFVCYFYIKEKYYDN